MSDQDRSPHCQVHRETIFQKYEGICHICNGPHADAIDHVVPQAKGGSHHPDNLRPSHTSCNSRKRDADPPEWTYANANMWKPGFGGKTVEEARRKEEARKATLMKQKAQEEQREAMRRAVEKAEKLRKINDEINKLRSEINSTSSSLVETRRKLERRVLPPMWSLISVAVAWGLALPIYQMFPQFGGFILIGLAIASLFLLSRARRMSQDFRSRADDKPRLTAEIKQMQFRLHTLRERLRLLEPKLPKFPRRYRRTYSRSYARSRRRR